MRSAQAKTQAHMEQTRALAAAIRMKRFAAKLWLGIREWCGDSAYERYVQAQRTNPEESCLLTPAEFYVERVNRRYSRPNRCC
ncbi:MAG TPA: CstA-like transporter-associated (seleno)protein [Candidatus Dormibacteraeota bacterium]|jgi:uncharacterized short protein YbdD (DUF466 family)|nr:CstA-like transporter-associated (seleno)protein [Candidatus Dormibacteraeota bacterium]